MMRTDSDLLTPKEQEILLHAISFLKKYNLQLPALFFTETFYPIKNIVISSIIVSEPLVSWFLKEEHWSSFCGALKKEAGLVFLKRELNNKKAV